MTIQERVYDYIINSLPVGGIVTPGRIAKNCYCEKEYARSIVNLLVDAGIVKKVIVWTSDGNIGYQKLKRK